jgi:hypothetical protein
MSLFRFGEFGSPGRRKVETILSILDFVVVLAVVISLSRAVWKGPSESSRSLALTSLLTVAFIIFGLVSLVAAAGLSAGSAFNQRALLISLVAIAAAIYMSWVNKPAAQ